MRTFLTGGTGFLGSHIAEACIDRGHDLRVLVEPDCDTQRLECLGAEIFRGDLRDQKSLRTGVDGCHLLIHAAAKVGDWGRWEDFYQTNVLGARRLYEAAEDAGVQRAVHISSTAVYGKKLIQDTPIDETMGPIPAERLPKWYAYGRSKSMAESLVWDIHERGSLKMAVIRPGWLYGPGDFKLLGRLVTMLQKRTAWIIGDGSNALMLTYVTNVVDAIMLAAKHEAAVGETFNVSNDVCVSQREFLDKLAEVVGAKHVRRKLPFRVAYAVATLLEASYRLLRIKQRPLITRQSMSLLGLSQVFATDKITDRLGWQPRVALETGLERIRDWWIEVDRRNGRQAPVDERFSRQAAVDERHRRRAA